MVFFGKNAQTRLHWKFSTVEWFWITQCVYLCPYIWLELFVGPIFSCKCLKIENMVFGPTTPGMQKSYFWKLLLAFQWMEPALVKETRMKRKIIASNLLLTNTHFKHNKMIPPLYGFCNISKTNEQNLMGPVSPENRYT